MRPIDADEIYKELQEECAECGNCSEMNPDGNCHIYMMMEILESATELLPEEIGGAEWIECGVGGTVKCSRCQFTDFFAKRDRVMLFKYCPACGAFMKEGNANETD